MEEKKGVKEQRPGYMLNRRQALKGGIAGGIALATAGLATTAGVQARSFSRANIFAKSGGTVVYGGYNSGSLASVLDPLEYLSSAAFAVCKLVYTPLMLLDENWKKMSPGLATSWQWSSDRKSLTVKLRHGVTFHDGTPFTAKDVDFSYKLMVHNDPFPSVSDPSVFVGGTEFAQNKTDTFGGLTVLDDYTVRFNLTAPYPDLLRNMTNIGIVPAHAFPSNVLSTTTSCLQMPFFQKVGIGTGPFMVDTVDIPNQIVLKANPKYWKGKPHLSSIVLPMNLTSASLVSGLRGGQVTAAYVSTASDADSLIGIPGLHTVKSTAMADQEVIYISCEKPYMNVSVRQALFHALNIPQLIKTTQYGLAKPSPSPMMSPSLFPNDSLQRYPYSPKKARELLQKGNWDPSRTMIMGYSLAGGAAQPTMIAPMMSMWEAVGVKTSFLRLDPANGLKLDYTPNHVFDLQPTALAWTSYDSSSNLQQFGEVPGASSVTGDTANYRNAQFNSLMVKAETATNPNVYYKQAQTLLSRDLPAIPLWIIDDMYFVSNKMKGGVLGRGPLNDVKAETWSLD